MPTVESPWIALENDDNGSLFTGAQQLVKGDVVEIKGENRHRTVTYVMGSTQKGWSACFGQLNGIRQGAVPVGPVQWRLVQSNNGVTALVSPEANVPEPTEKPEPQPQPQPHSQLMSTKLILEILLALIGVVGGIVALWRAFQ